MGNPTLWLGGKQVAWGASWLHCQGVHQRRPQTGWSVSFGPERAGYISLFILILYIHHVSEGTRDIRFRICVHHFDINDGVFLTLSQMADLKIPPDDCHIIWCWLEYDIFRLDCPWGCRFWSVSTGGDKGFRHGWSRKRMPECPWELGNCVLCCADQSLGRPNCIVANIVGIFKKDFFYFFTYSF